MAEDFGGKLVEPGLWVEHRNDRSFPQNSPALFVDRDGTLNVDTSYPRDPAEIVLLPGIVSLVANANRAGIPVVMVTNQSGIARSLLTWHDFAAVQERLARLMDDAGAHVDLVLACAYHEAGEGALQAIDHPLRKPNPGMFLRARNILAIGLGRSAMIGDKEDDLLAARRAGLTHAWQVGTGPNELTRGKFEAWLATAASV